MIAMMKQLNLVSKKQSQLQQANISIEEKQQNMPPYPRIVPFPWESLASVVSRASRSFGIRHPKQLLRTPFSIHYIDEGDLLTLTNIQDYVFLEYELQIDTETLYRLTIHRFSDLLQRYNLYTVAGMYPSLELNARSWLFPDTNHIKVCPQCLAEEGYDRLYWIARMVSVCPYHHTLLVSVCPSCQKEVQVLRPCVFHCPFCSSEDYRT